MRYVILPQAIHIALPPTVGFLVQLVKATSLAAIIGVTELTRAGQIINNATFRPFLVFENCRGDLLHFVLAAVCTQRPAGTALRNCWEINRATRSNR